MIRCRFASLVVLAIGSLLGGCASSPPPQSVASPPAPAETRDVGPAPPALRAYPETDAFLWCVPFARAVSGITIHGDAWTWWDKARGRYATAAKPRVGAVLVFKRGERLRLGHVGVVAQVGDDPRMALITHANWGSTAATRGVIHERQPMWDVSPANDWTQVRLMTVHGVPGGIYQTWGFILPPDGAERVARR
jgi:hypothetical protein